MMESTQELLSNYTQGDDISVYSVSDQPDLSDLYDLLDDDSIEIRRATLTTTPAKTPTRARMSPAKVRNDYLDHIFKARGSPKKPDFGLDSYDTLEHNIDKFLDRLNRADLFDGGDNTEPIIRETHKLIKNVPRSITSSKEGEMYSKLLTSSIHKLISSYEAVRRENRDHENVGSENRVLAEKNTTLANDNRRLRDKIAEVNQENSRLRDAVEQANRRAKQVVPQQNSQYKRENELLREKLIKYKQLAEVRQQENAELRRGRDNVREKPVYVEDRARDAGPEDQARSETVVSRAKHGEKYNMLPLFEQLVEEMRRESETNSADDRKSVENEHAAGASPITTTATNKGPLRDLVASLHKNNELMAETNARLTKLIDKEKIVLQVVCCRDHEESGAATNNGASEPQSPITITKKNEPKQTKAKPATPARASSQSVHVPRPDKVCVRCSGMEAKNETVSLMGEYKWAI